MWEKIKNYGLQLGLDDIGCASPKVDYELLAILKKRIYCEYDLSIESNHLMARIDPKLHLKSVNSIVVCLVQIPIAHEYIVPKGSGRLSSLSWGLDYHIYLRKILNQLAKYMKTLDSNVETWIQVDTGPLHERHFAHNSGLGTIGKSGNFIHPTLGTYVAIGLILTNLDLPVGEAKPSICGECRRCIDACPGNAIKENGVLNPRECVSWLTQSKEELSEKQKRKMGDCLYGCDRCQLVCPQNSGIIEKSTQRWGKLFKYIDLEKIEGLSNREFKREYGTLSGSWRGKKTWLRNGKIIRSNQENLCYNRKE